MIRLLNFRKANSFLTVLGVIVGMLLLYNLVFISWHQQVVHKRLEQKATKGGLSSPKCETFVCKAVEKVTAVSLKKMN